jgi:hypothetical protein
MKLVRLVRGGVAAAAVLIAAGAFAPPASAQGMDPDQERARQLIVRIRRSMREIDSLLLSGAQPDKVEKELAANQKRIEELLKETESKSQAVIQNIDELIKLTKYQEQKDPQQGKGGGSGDDPQNDPQKQPQRGKSDDPQELQKQPKPEGEQPQDGSGKKPEPKPEKKPGDGDPKHGGPDKSKPEQSQGTPPKSATGEFERASAAGRWGMLPPKEAEDLQRRDAEEFPQRYRRWMELYFQRVNKLPARDH